MTNVLMRDRRGQDRERRGGGDHMKTEAEDGMIHPQAKEWLKPAEVRR